MSFLNSKQLTLVTRCLQIKFENKTFKILKKKRNLTDGGKATNTHFTSDPQIRSQSGIIAACAYLTDPHQFSLPAKSLYFYTVKPLITNTSKEFITCRILHFYNGMLQIFSFLIRRLYRTL